MTHDRPADATSQSPTHPADPGAGAGTTEPGVNRRLLLRGGAVLAGAAGVTVVGAALSPVRAAAADGDTVQVGGSFTGTKSTRVTINPGTAAPLELVNTNGPALHLNVLPDDWEGDLAPGDLATDGNGPLTAVDLGTSTVTTYVATGLDLATIPVATPVDTPVRLLDTRTAAGRKQIVRRSTSALDSAGRLKAGAWIDVAVSSAQEGVLLSAVFVNATVVQPARSGFLSVYPAGDRPNVSTVNYGANVNLSNAAFVGVGDPYASNFIVRIYSSATTHVLLDLSGATVSADLATLAPASVNTQRRNARQAKRAAALKAGLRRAAEH